DILLASGKSGIGIEEILQAIVERIPAPEGSLDAPLQALIFDSVYNSFRGIIVYYRILNGVLKKNDKIRFISTGSDYNADEVGVLKL
ncbi:elongation factor 4, partial [Acinetobacter baumannii]